MPTNQKSGGRSFAEPAIADNIREPKLGSPNFDKPPHSIYFFYIGDKIQGTTWNRILHYYDHGDDQPIDSLDKLRTKISPLIINAREPSEGNQFPPPIGAGWRHVVLSRISWVVIAFDFPITQGPEVSIYHGRNANHSFYDGDFITIEGCKVVYCINHLKRAPRGVPLGHERQDFRFELITVPAITWEGMPQLPDSGGTNTGPGTSPP